MRFVPLNLALLSNPWNWGVVTLMIMLFGFGITLITQLAEQAPGKSSQ
jgi:hypothetical protein